MASRAALVPILFLAACAKDAPPPPTRAAAASPAPALPSAPQPVAAVDATPARVVVVGGGLAGLVTAYELKKRGITSHVLEAADLWGGRVATATYGPGLTAEYGLQEIWEENPVLPIAKELGVPLDSQVVEAFSSLVIDGKLRPYVQDTADAYFASFLAPDELAAFHAWLERVKALHQLAVAKGLAAPEVKKLQGLPFGAWVRKEGLPKHVEDTIRMTLECELAADWDSFSGVVGLLEFGVFLGGGQPAHHVHGGNIRLIDALVAALHGPMTLSATVLAVERAKQPDGRIVARVSYAKGGKVETVTAERVVLTVPFARVHQIRIDPPLSSEKWQGILTLNRGGYTVVHLIVDKAARALWQIDGKSPFPVLTDGVLGVVYGVVEESPPEQPLEVFSLLVHGVAAHAFHMIPRETKVKEILVALDKLWPGLSEHVRESYVYTYHPAAIAVWPPGRSPIDERGKAMREPEMGLYLAGDWTVSGHSTGAVQSALRVADAVARDLGAK